MTENDRLARIPRPIGLMAVIEHFQLQIPLPAVRSAVVAGARKTRVDHGSIYEHYPRTYATRDLYEDLKFAMRYEPIDLGILKAAFRKIDPEMLAERIKHEALGIYARKIWYLYELLTADRLDLPDVVPTGYVDLLNPKTQLVGAGFKVKRQRVNDNLLGNRDYCPIVRVTDRFQNFIVADLKNEARKMIADVDPRLLARAINFLYTTETKSSFAIEGEHAGRNRAERFVAALESAAEFDPGDKKVFVNLQNQIVDARYASSDWRVLQNYVGQTMRDYSEQVHFVCPKPKDVPELMCSWMNCVERLQTSGIDPIAVAATIAFGFVFIHPFDDGNGRIHRFLIHHELARSGFTPMKLIFPISAVMVRERAEYDRVLQTYAKSVLPFITYSLDGRGYMTVENDTADLYRYWDATNFVEYLYGCVEETIRHELKDELNFLVIFDQALSAVMNIVDMPDRRASLLVRMIIQNRGTLSNNKRFREFPELTDLEIGSIEKEISEIIEEVRA